nr:rRNA 2'-O-methyltransferase fibrillarin-like [Aegilops tauschii subsp. strangulata]
MRGRPEVAGPELELVGDEGRGCRGRSWRRSGHRGADEEMGRRRGDNGARAHGGGEAGATGRPADGLRGGGAAAQELGLAQTCAGRGGGGSGLRGPTTGSAGRRLWGRPGRDVAGGDWRGRRRR